MVEGDGPTVGCETQIISNEFQMSNARHVKAPCWRIEDIHCDVPEGKLKGVVSVNRINSFMVSLSAH